MLSYCSLDRLPVEILHSIFNYFFAHELLLSFVDVSTYINKILFNYSSYQVSVHRISSDQLDQIDLYIRPDQIISLTLSDDVPITEAFFSRFRIEQFTRLRCLKLLQIEYNVIPLIFTHLDRLEYLHVVSFDTSLVRHRYPAWNDDYRHESIRFNRFLQSSFNKILPHLTHLSLNSIRISTSLALLCLQHVVLTQCSANEFNSILQQAKQLQSIDIGLCGNTWNPNMTFSSSPLKDFRLKITGNPVSLEQIEQLLKQLPCLEKFTLECFGRMDLLDGNRWPPITHRLLSFNFKFTISSPMNINHCIASFSTDYWSKEKRWLIVSDGQYIFSIPHFSPDYMDLSERNSSEYSFINDKVTKLVVRNPTMSHVYRFASVEHLELYCPLTWYTCESIVDSKRLVNLSVDSFNYLLPFLQFQSALPCLTAISINQPITIDSIKSYRDYSWIQIRQLKLNTIYQNNRSILEELFRFLPSIESLVYVSRELTTEMMIQIINGFEKLSSASFHTDATFAIKESDCCRNPELFVDRIGRFRRKSIQCRVHHTINSRLSLQINWYIQNAASTPSHWKTAMQQLTYNCYKCKYSMKKMLSRSSTMYGHDLWIVISAGILLSAIALIVLFLHIAINAHFLYDFLSNGIVCYLIDCLRHQFKTRNHIIVHLCLCVILFIFSQMIRALCFQFASY